MNNYTKHFYKQLENLEFYDEINDKKLVLETLNFPTTHLLYKIEDIQKDIEFSEDLLKLTAWQSHGMSLMLVVEKNNRCFNKSEGFQIFS